MTAVNSVHNTKSPPSCSLNELRSRKLGIALGGGAARGFAHIGFLREMDRAGLKAHCLSGCSIGAFVGAAYAGGNWESFADRALNLQWRDLLGLVDPILPRCGLMDGDKALGFLSDFLRVANLEDCTPPLAVNATDAMTGEEVVITSGPIISAVRASIALPGMFTPSRQGTRLLLDGGLVNPLPVNLCRQLGADTVLAVDLNAHVLDADVCCAEERLETEEPNAGQVSWSALLQGLTRRVLEQPVIGKLIAPSEEPDTPKISPPGRMLNLFAVLINSIYIMQRTLNRMRLEKEPPEFLIQPELRDFRLMDFLKGPACSEAGAKAAREFLRDCLQDQSN
jgi:NTE family protein